MTDVGALHHDDSRILAKRPGELPIPDIDGDHPSRRTSEQDIGEAPGRGADVKADTICDVDTEGVERCAELFPAAAHVGRASSDLDR